MTKQFTNNFVVINLYKKPSIKSEVVTQMLYGESFSILKKSRKWLKIKIKEDGYKGYIKNNNFPQISEDGRVKVVYARGPEGIFIELVEEL